MHPRQSKLYEVDRIAGRRQSKGKIEYLVCWKGYDSSEATWEPTENLRFCNDIVKKFVSQTVPIPGGIPCRISELIQNKKRTVGVQLLLQKKRKRRMNKISADHDANIDLKKQIKKRHRMSESEKLVRDTLLHESKTIRPKSLVVNGLFDFPKPRSTSIIRNSRASDIAGSLVCKPKKRKFGEEFSDVLTVQGEKRPFTSLNGISFLTMNYSNSKNPLRDAGEGDHIICHRTDNCMKIILNNTARHNLLTVNMMETIANCLATAQQDPSVNAIIIRNNGDHFCSGIDYSELIDCSDKQQHKSKVMELCTAIRTLTEALIECKKPVLTAANGVCLEYGVAIIAMSDLTFTSSKTQFELTFSKLNLTPVGCLTYLLPKLVGPAMANAMMYLNESYRATAAYDRGLINDIYGVHSFDEDIGKRIKQVVAGNVQVMEETKQMMRAFEIDKLRHALDIEMKAFSKLLLTEKCQKKLRLDWTVTINLYGTV